MRAADCMCTCKEPVQSTKDWPSQRASHAAYYMEQHLFRHSTQGSLVPHELGGLRMSVSPIPQPTTLYRLSYPLLVQMDGFLHPSPNPAALFDAYETLFICDNSPRVCVCVCDFFFNAEVFNLVSEQIKIDLHTLLPGPGSTSSRGVCSCNKTITKCQQEAIPSQNQIRVCFAAPANNQIVVFHYRAYPSLTGGLSCHSSFW